MEDDKIIGDERYRFTNSDTIHKVDGSGKSDVDGYEFHKVQELDDGYYVYIKPNDPSQPNPTYFIHKKYFVK